MPLLQRTVPSIKDLVPSLGAKVNTADIVNDTTSGGTTVPLSAEQGKDLKTEIGTKVSTGDIINDLVTGGGAVPLSAEQGVILKGLINAMSNGLEYKGLFDASVGVWPADPSQGDFYKVSTAGTINGVDLGPGDMLISNGDVVGASAAADWDVIDNTEAADILRWGDVSTAIDLGGAGASDTIIASQKAIKQYVDDMVAALGGGEVKVKVDKNKLISGDTFTTTFEPKDGVVFMDVAVVDNGDGSYDEWENISFSGTTGTLVGASSAYDGKTCKITYIHIV